MAHKRTIQLTCSVLMMGYSAPAAACNFCAMALFDYFLPPVFAWQFLPVVWFLSICIITKRCDSYTWGIPSVFTGAIISLVFVVFGNGFGLGPFPVLILLTPGIILSINSLRKSVREKWGPDHSKQNVIVSAIGVTSLIFLLVFSIYVHFSRTPGEYVVSWGVYGPGRSIIAELKNNPDSDLGQIRLIVSEADDFATAELAETLARRGEAIIDFPILLDALRRTRESAINYRERDIESALRIVTGLELEQGTSLAEWESAYNSKIKTNISNISNAAEAKSCAAD